MKLWHNTDEVMTMKKTLLLSTLSVAALVACGTPTPSQSLPSEMVDEALSNPNRMLLNTMMAMATSSHMSTETTFELDGTFRQSVRESGENFQSIYTTLLSVNAEATLQTNDLLGSAPQAQFDLTLNNFRFLQSESFMGQSFTNDITFTDQSLSALYDDGMAYVDLSGAETMLQSLSLISPQSLKLKFPVQSPESLGLSPQEMTPEDQEQFVNDWLPFVDTIPGLEASISGSFLNLEYAVTQEEFNQMVRDMFLQGTETLTLSSEETAYLDDMIEGIIALVTIETFEFSLQLNLLTSQITSLRMDVDVELNDTFEYESFVGYDPENPAADEYGFIYELVTVETLTVIDVFAQLNMASFQESRPIAVLINKEEYTLVDLGE
jgi:hypothetical protein